MQCFPVYLLYHKCPQPVVAVITSNQRWVSFLLLQHHARIRQNRVRREQRRRNKEKIGLGSGGLRSSAALTRDARVAALSKPDHGYKRRNGHSACASNWTAAKAGWTSAEQVRRTILPTVLCSRRSPSSCDSLTSQTPHSLDRLP